MKAFSNIVLALSKPCDGIVQSKPRLVPPYGGVINLLENNDELRIVSCDWREREPQDKRRSNPQYIKGHKPIRLPRTVVYLVSELTSTL